MKRPWFSLYWPSSLNRTKSNNKAHLKKKTRVCLGKHKLFFPISLDSSFLKETLLKTWVQIPTDLFGNYADRFML